MTSSVLHWREFQLPQAGSLSCAVTSRPGGRLCGLMRIGDRTVVVKSEKMGAPITVQDFKGSESGKLLTPVPGSSRRYHANVGSKRYELDVDRPTPDRLTVSVGGTEAPLVLHYYGDRGLVTTGQDPVPPSLMRGGSKIRVGRSHGYGIFAVEDIDEGEIVDEAPTLSQDTPFLHDYTFVNGGKHILPLGNVALYNHSDDPTCAHSIDSKGEVMTLTARRPIKAGSELSINYGPLYFFARGKQAKPIGEGESSLI